MFTDVETSRTNRPGNSDGGLQIEMRSLAELSKLWQSKTCLRKGLGPVGRSSWSACTGSRGLCRAADHVSQGAPAMVAAMRPSL